jgi:hypothetical protein
VAFVLGGNLSGLQMRTGRVPRWSGTTTHFESRGELYLNSTPPLRAPAEPAGRIETSYRQIDWCKNRYSPRKVFRRGWRQWLECPKSQILQPSRKLSVPFDWIEPNSCFHQARDSRPDPRPFAHSLRRSRPLTCRLEKSVRQTRWHHLWLRSKYGHRQICIRIVLGPLRRLRAL